MGLGCDVAAIYSNNSFKYETIIAKIVKIYNHNASLLHQRNKTGIYKICVKK